MRKYFYTDGLTKFGPFFKDELKGKNLTRETLVWYYGLGAWTSISEIEDLKEVLLTFPPPIIPKVDENDVRNVMPELPNHIEVKNKNKARPILKWFIIALILLIAILGSYVYFNQESRDEKLYNQIVSSSFEGDEDFDLYVKKFFRDAGTYGLIPKQPSTTIIRFARLDQITDATHIHAISYGVHNDDLIEIYINPSTWEKFNKAKRHYLIYHELAHDLLNVDDLPNSESNNGKLMFPAIASYEGITMDEFIEASHSLFEEVSKE